MLIESYQTVYVKMKKPLRNVSKRLLVEIVGVEPTTPCLQSRCSSQLSYTPLFFASAKMVYFFETTKFF